MTDVVLAADLSASAGPIGLLLVVLIAVATVLLIRNMDKRMKRLPKEFPPPPGPEQSPRS
jgi:hypothetical protein